jgi:hypothetical protein
MAAKVLGQSAPSATTNADLYTVPSAKSAVCSTLTVCNRAATPGTYRVAVRPGGATIANAHYLVYGVELPANGTDAWTIGLTLTATDVVTVYASSADFSFSLFGDES